MKSALSHADEKDTCGQYTGLQALLSAEAKSVVKPHILGLPGLDTQPVTATLVS